METVIRNVGDIDSHDRQALEHVLGQTLRANQQLIVQIINLSVVAPASSGETSAELSQPDRNGGTELPDWCNVYAGLSDDEIADLEKIILTRADLSRPPE